MSFSRTIIIGCAGMGNRLGLGTTKALVEVEGKPLIIRHLEQLKDEDDVRIVVGYQAEKVIQYILSLDGDLLIHPTDMQMILACTEEFVGGNPVETDDPWMLQTYKHSEKEYVSAFSKCMGNYEWNGITQMKSQKMLRGTGHVFQLIEPYLPVQFMKIRTKEIDTVNDYERAVEWVRNGYK